MGWLDNLGISPRDTLPESETPEVLERILDQLPTPVGTDIPITMPKVKQQPKQNAFDWKNIKRPSWEKPLYDLDEVARATRVEGYAATSINKHREHVLRHGWEYVSKNPRAKAYIIRRLTELGESMNRPVEKEIRRAVTNFIKYSNFMLSWTRDRNRPYTSRFGISRGRPTGLFSMNPTAMRYRRTKKNAILDWYQVVTGHDDEAVKPMDVVHGAFDQDEGIVLGVPFILPILDDIMALRRFEEMAEIMAHKFAYPLFHHRIGTEKRDPETYDDGTNEIGEASSIVAGMAPEGHLFTSHRHVIEVVGAKNKALDLKPMIEYWEARVLAGLNLSPIDIGRGNTSNRATAETISKGLADRCGEYQEEFALVFNFYVLDELLLEGGFTLTPENKVMMVFPPIDREAKRAEETHLLLLYQGNAITHDELRIRMGLEGLGDSDWKKTYFEQVAKPLVIAGKADQASGGGPKDVRNTAKPTNQTGTKATKTRVTKDNLYQVLSTYESLTDKQLEADIIGASTQIAEVAMTAGIDRYNTEYGASAHLGPGLLKGFVTDCVELYVQQILTMSGSALAAASSLNFYLTAFQTAAVNYGYARAAQIDTRRSWVRWKLKPEACEDCKNLPKIFIRRFTLGQMLPGHDKCMDGLEVCDQMTQEDYLLAEARLRSAGKVIDSLVSMRLRGLEDAAFCGPDKTFMIDDEVTAVNALAILDSTRLLPTAKREDIREAVTARIKTLGFTLDEAQARVAVLREDGHDTIV